LQSVAVLVTPRPTLPNKPPRTALPIPRHNARQCMLTRGLVPILATPSPSGDAILDEAVKMATK